jgi:hypothetical protein
MAIVTVKINGIEAVNARLDRLKGMDWAVTPMQQSLNTILARMQEYPPERVGSKYRRTRVLFGGWHVKPLEKSATRLRGTVGSGATEYAPFVQHHLLQSWVHRGRWKTDAQVVEEESARIAQFFRDAIERATR